MDYVTSISTAGLYWKKIQGCYREFCLIETIRRTIREPFLMLRKSQGRFDVSLITEHLAIGAAPMSFNFVRRLRKLGLRQVIDLWAERKQADVLAITKDVEVEWVPTYDDWVSKPSEFFQKLEMAINKILSSENGGRLFLCCGAGEHRAPLAGVLALVSLGYSFKRAEEMVREARPLAELLSVYKLSLAEFLKEHLDDL